MSPREFLQHNVICRRELGREHVREHALLVASKEMLHSNVVRNQLRSLIPVDTTYARLQQGLDLLPSLNLGRWQSLPLISKPLRLALPTTFLMCPQFGIRILSICNSDGGNADEAEHEKV